MVTWNRVQFDGTTLKVWQIAGTSTAPTESDWTAIYSSPELSSTSPRTTGGRIGFMPCYGGYNCEVGDLTLKSYDTGTSAFDITEATENFTLDGSNFADDTLTSDNNGNQTYDGLQAYTYDAWNRLKTVAHSSSSSAGGPCTGQVSSTTSYDALGRRIVKTVSDTGSWDGTLNYYLDGDSVVEEQNGSGMTVKQFIWGAQYIDDLIQVSLNSSPSTQSTCDTPYWAMCDANWNVLGLVNSSGTLTERYEYTAYGQRTVYFSAGGNDPYCYAPTTASQKFVTSGSVTQFYGLCEVGFQGLMHDEENGLIYARHRDEDTLLQRWTEQDPTIYVDGLNLYQEERSNPIDNSDPLGLASGGYMGHGQCCKQWVTWWQLGGYPSESACEAAVKASQGLPSWVSWATWGTTGGLTIIGRTSWLNGWGSGVARYVAPYWGAVSWDLTAWQLGTSAGASYMCGNAICYQQGHLCNGKCQ